MPVSAEVLAVLPTDIAVYPALLSDIELLPADRRQSRLKALCRSDLYFLLRYGCKRYDMEKQWLLDRCREVQGNPDGMLDLWSRDHYKSSIITFGLTIQDILADPEITVAIFSHTRPIAKAFLRQIKRELETNRFLQTLFPEVLYRDPEKESKKWSEDDGIVVKREGNPKEATVEAWGLVDGQPISKHYRLKVYDDIVTRESVTSPEMIKKTTSGLEDSFNLGTEGGKDRFVGTRWHCFDTYSEIMKRGTAVPRIKPATDDGTETGKPVLISQESLDKKRRDMGPYVFSAQMLLSPAQDAVQGFKTEWFKTYRKAMPEGLNKYILVDPANAKRKSNDYTTQYVIGLGADRNYMVLEMVRDRMNLTERTRSLFELHRKWGPILAVGYEQYGMQADIQHIQSVMEDTNYRFAITELGGNIPKIDRMKKLIPLFEGGRIWFPETAWRTNYERKTEDLVQVFFEEEYKSFPVMRHDDMMDLLARIEDEKFKLFMKFPQVETRARSGGFVDRSVSGLGIFAR